MFFVMYSLLRFIHYSIKIRVVTLELLKKSSFTGIIFFLWEPNYNANTDITNNLELFKAANSFPASQALSGHISEVHATLSILPRHLNHDESRGSSISRIRRSIYTDRVKDRQVARKWRSPNSNIVVNMVCVAFAWKWAHTKGQFTDKVSSVGRANWRFQEDVPVRPGRALSLIAAHIRESRCVIANTIGTLMAL